MSKYDVSAIRNIAFIGHGSSGKTTLCEALLQHIGLTTRVPAGIMDYAPDEKERGHSIDLAVARFSWNEKEITILDVPGYQDFYHNAVSALSVVESAVVAISATDGITVNTRRVWDVANKKCLPRVIALTKLDGENINFNEVIEKIQKQFGAHCIPLIVPNEVGSQLSKVRNLLNEGETGACRSKLIETIVETDDELLNRYLEGEEISSEMVRKQLRLAMLQNKVVPIVAAVPTRKVGIEEFLGIIADFLPSPLEAAPRKGKTPRKSEEISYEASPQAPFSAQVFRVYNDPFGRIIFLRLWSGTLNSATTIYDVNTETTERVASIFHMLGKEQKSTDRAIAGEIVTFAKVENLKIGDTLVTNEKEAILYEKPIYPTPMVSLAVLPKSRDDEQKISASLNKLAEEDPTFWVKRTEETSELVVAGMSNLHLELMLNRMKNRFKVECTHSLPKIPYRETITGKGESRYRHKKQTGGRGQFAEVAIRIEPTERGVGFDFVDQIVGGVIPAQFVLSTEKGIAGVMKKGILAGYHVVDVRVSVYDGKTHEVDSSDAAFQVAASRAFQEAFAQAGPVLLEPIENIEITVPSQYMGDVSGHLNSKRGRIIGNDMEGDFQTIRAQIPLAEVMTYSSDLKSMTGGEGTYKLEFSHYDIVPPNIQEKIIAKAKEEKKNQ